MNIFRLWRKHLFIWLRLVNAFVLLWWDVLFQIAACISLVCSGLQDCIDVNKESFLCCLYATSISYLPVFVLQMFDLREFWLG